jgi:hypothetical protein
MLTREQLQEQLKSQTHLIESQMAQIRWYRQWRLDTCCILEKLAFLGTVPSGLRQDIQCTIDQKYSPADTFDLLEMATEFQIAEGVKIRKFGQYYQVGVSPMLAGMASPTLWYEVAEMQFPTASAALAYLIDHFPQLLNPKAGLNSSTSNVGVDNIQG